MTEPIESSKNAEEIAAKNDGFTNQLAPVSTEANDLQSLVDHHQQIQQWIQMVNNKIYEMESSYLEDCVSGNIIKGWDIDGRNLPIHRSRSSIDEKDRIFSFSSYSYWMEKKNSTDSNTNDKAVAQATLSKANSLKYRKQKKRKVDYEDWNGNEDY
eukprot:gene5573-5990_t